MLNAGNGGCCVSGSLGLVEVLSKACELTTLRAYKFLNTDDSETRKAVKEGEGLVTTKELSALNKARQK